MTSFDALVRQSAAHQRRAYVGLRGGLRGVCGDMPSIGELMHADPRTRDLPNQLKLVPTVWVQRGINAWYASIRSSTRVTVDGVAGRHTLAALLDISGRLIRTGIASSLPGASIEDAAHVSIPYQVHDAMKLTARVEDPPGSTIGVCDWTPPARLVDTAVTPSGQTIVGPASSDAGAAVSHDSMTASSAVSSVMSDDVLYNALAFGVAAIVGIGATAIVFRKRGRR